MTDDNTDARQERQEEEQRERGAVRVASPNPGMVSALLEERQATEHRQDLTDGDKADRLAQIDKSLEFYGHQDGDAPETEAAKLARKQTPIAAGSPADDGGEHARQSMIQGLLEEREGLKRRAGLEDSVRENRIGQVNESLKFYGHSDNKDDAAQERAEAAESGDQTRETPPKGGTTGQAGDGKQTRSTAAPKK